MTILSVFIGLQVGIVVGGLIFDLFISRPTLRLLNEEIKKRDNVIEKLTQYSRDLEFRINQLSDIK